MVIYMNKNNEFKKERQEKRLNELKENKYNDNNNKDPYGYDFVPAIAHWTNIDEQRKEVKKLENITNTESNKKELDRGKNI